MSLWKRVLPVVLVAVLFAMTAVPTFAIKPEERASIIDVALDVNAATGSFDILIGAVLAADEAIFNTLDGNGQFTVFAPTDAAFETLFGLPEADILAYLTSIEDGSEAQANLTGTLLYHVARGNREAAEVLSSDQIRMLSGDFTYISIQEDMPYINQAQIIIPDVTMPDNGVIHAIDAVLIP
jgi:transforming growth factor-beta-induced protein